MKCEQLHFLTDDDKEVSFTVYHNLPNVQGLSFDNAFANWYVRTNVFTAKSLCDYIMSKGTGYVCSTKQKS